jgi:hypothetical protein
VVAWFLFLFIVEDFIPPSIDGDFIPPSILNDSVAG